MKFHAKYQNFSLKLKSYFINNPKSISNSPYQILIQLFLYLKTYAEIKS